MHKDEARPLTCVGGELVEIEITDDEDDEATRCLRDCENGEDKNEEQQAFCFSPARIRNPMSKHPRRCSIGTPEMRRNCNILELPTLYLRGIENRKFHQRRPEGTEAAKRVLASPSLLQNLVGAAEA